MVDTYSTFQELRSTGGEADVKINVKTPYNEVCYVKKTLRYSIIQD